MRQSHVRIHEDTAIIWTAVSQCSDHPPQQVNLYSSVFQFDEPSNATHESASTTVLPNFFTAAYSGVKNHSSRANPQCQHELHRPSRSAEGEDGDIVWNAAWNLSSRKPVELARLTNL